MTRQLAETLTTVALLILFSVYLWQSSGYGDNARLIPTIVGIGALGVAIVQLVGPHIALLRPLVFGKADTNGSGAAEPNNRRVLAIIAWTIGLMALIYLVGFIFAVPAALILLFAVVEKKISIQSIIITTFLTGLSWVFTIYLLNFRWYDWLFWRAIGIG